MLFCFVAIIIIILFCYCSVFLVSYFVLYFIVCVPVGKNGICQLLEGEFKIKSNQNQWDNKSVLVLYPCIS